MVVLPPALRALRESIPRPPLPHHLGADGRVHVGRAGGWGLRAGQLGVAGKQAGLSGCAACVQMQGC